MQDFVQLSQIISRGTLDIFTFHQFQKNKSFCPTFFQKSFSSFREATTEPEPELFVKEPEPCQTGPLEYSLMRTYT